MPFIRGLSCKLLSERKAINVEIFLIILGSETKEGVLLQYRGYATFATMRSLAYDFPIFFNGPQGEC